MDEHRTERAGSLGVDDADRAVGADGTALLRAALGFGPQQPWPVPNFACSLLRLNRTESPDTVVAEVAEIAPGTTPTTTPGSTLGAASASLRRAG